VSDGSSFAEEDTASGYATPLSGFDRADCALGVVDEPPAVVYGVRSNSIHESITIQGDACVVVTCDLATPERSWAEFRRTPRGTKRLTSDCRVFTLKTEVENPQPPNRPVAPRTPSLTQQFAAALKNDDTEGALDAIFDAVDTALLADRFRECNRALAAVRVDEWSTDLLIGLLSITAAASHELPERAAFFERTRRALVERGDDTPGLLDGLE